MTHIPLPESLADPAAKLHIEKRYIAYEGAAAVSTAAQCQHQDLRNTAVIAQKLTGQQNLQPIYWFPAGNAFQYTPFSVAMTQAPYQQFSGSNAAATHSQQIKFQLCQHQLYQQQRQQMQCQQKSLDENMNPYGSQPPQSEIKDINAVHAAVNMTAIVSRLMNELAFSLSHIDRNAAKEAIDIIRSDTTRIALMQAINICIRNVMISEIERVASLITTSTESHIQDNFSSQWDLQKTMQFTHQIAHHVTFHYTTNTIMQLLQNAMPSCIAAELSKLGMKEAAMRGITASMVTAQVLQPGTTFIQTAIAEQATQKILIKLRQLFSRRRSVGQAEHFTGDIGCQSSWNALSASDKAIVPMSQQQIPSRAGILQIQLPSLSTSAMAQVQQQHQSQTIYWHPHFTLLVENCCKSLASQICDTINNLTTLISADSPRSPVLNMLQNFKVRAMQATNIDMFDNLAFFTLNSFMVNYNLFEGQVLDDIKRIHLSIFRTLRQPGQGSWIKGQVTRGWMLSANGEALLGTSALNFESDSGQQGVGSIWAWNWKAFAELLRHELIHLHIIDSHLAFMIKTGHPEAVTFVFNLLDKFVLPTIAGTPREIGDEKLGQLAMNATHVVRTDLGNIFKVAHKREFTVLNEFDLWKSMQAIEKLQATASLISSDFNLRLHLTCARIRALMDWGLFESKGVQMVVNKNSEEYRALLVGISRSKEIDEFEKTKGFVENACNWWCCRYKDWASSRSNLESLIDQWLAYLSTSKIVKDDEDVLRFFRTAITLIIDEATSNLIFFRSKGSGEKDPGSQKAKLDAFAGLLAICIKRGTGTTGNKNRIILLNRILGMLGGKLMQLHEITSEDFEPFPFQRILIKLFTELYEFISTSASADQKPDERGETSLTHPTLLEYIPVAFGSLLHLLRPSRMPKFQLAFLEIISDTQFIRRMLGGTEPDLIPRPLQMAYRGIYAQLLADLTSHVAFFFKNAVENPFLTPLYSSICQLWLSLFSEFPDFISEFSLYFSNFLSISTCFLRNLVISARPNGMRITRTGSLRGSLEGRLDELEDPIGYVMEASNRLPPLLRADIDSYLTTRTPTDLPNKLHLMLQRVGSVAALLANPPPLLMSALSVMQSSKQHSPLPPRNDASKGEEAKYQIELSDAVMQANTSIFWAAVGSQTLSTYGLDTSTPYITEMISDLVVHLCITAVKTLRESKSVLSAETIANTPQMEILRSLLRNLDEGGQYLLVSCMVNQLRYKNSHTCYFSHCLLHLFSMAPEVKLKEVISRLLIEHLIINAPHSEGLLATYYELIKNPEYKFWTEECSGINQCLLT